MTITDVTRRALVRDLLHTSWWWGDLDEVEFLGRLYNLAELPTTDDRYDNARSDIIQHRVANDDWENEWVFWDERFGLQDDKQLLTFLAETIHPAVRSDRDAVERLAALYNSHLQEDGWELCPKAFVSGRPVFGHRRFTRPPATPRQLREAIAESVWRNLSANDVAAFCESDLGLAPQTSHGDDPMASKRAYVKRRLEGHTLARLVQVAERVAREFTDTELRTLAEGVVLAERGVPGQGKNIIFACDGPKPDLVLQDAINNDLRFVANEGNCLVYDRPLEAAGLSWSDLVAWWQETHPVDHPEDKRTAGLRLHRRLLQSLNDGPEQLILDTYARLYGSEGFDLPALFPQVYLHFDPMTAARRGGGPRPLVRQRMDFLLLMEGRRRVVIELDGKQHYAEGDRASPRLYASMVREDRRLRLDGYEVFRFGGYELKELQSGTRLLTDFFRELLAIDE